MKKSSLVIVLLLLAVCLATVPAWAEAAEAEKLTAPQLTSLPPIVFSEAISKEYAGQQVTVRLRVSLSDSGAVNADSIQIVDSSGNDGIDQAVISSVKGAVFTPAYQSGKAVPITLLLPLKVKVPDNPPPAANAPEAKK